MHTLYRKIRVVHITFIFIALMIFLFIYYPVYAFGTLFFVIYIAGVLGVDFDLDILFSTDTFWGISQKKKERLLALEKARNKPHKPLLPTEHLGKEVIVLNALGPSGRVDIEGEKFQAISDMGFIDAGTRVVVDDIRMNQYVVRPVDDTD